MKQIKFVRGWIVVASFLGSLVNTTAQNTPVVVSSPASVTIVSGSELSLSVSAQGSGLSFQWQQNGIDVPRATNASFTIVASTKLAAGVYRARVTKKGGSVFSDEATVTVFDNMVWSE